MKYMNDASVNQASHPEGGLLSQWADTEGTTGEGGEAAPWSHFKAKRKTSNLNYLVGIQHVYQISTRVKTGSEKKKTAVTSADRWTSEVGHVGHSYSKLHWLTRGQP